MSVVGKALSRSRAKYESAYTSALQMKQAGQLGPVDLGGSSAFNQLNQFRQQGANKQRYSLFRGWVYSVINALAQEAGQQPANLGELKGSQSGNRRSSPSQTKDYSLRKMTKAAQSKAAKEEFEVITSHPIVDALERPNFFQYSFDFVYTFVASVNLTGWGFIVADSDEDGNLSFVALPTTWVRPMEKFTKFKIVDPNNPSSKESKEPLDISQVGFARLPNPADPRAALAPAQGQINAIKIDDQIQTSQQVYFDNAVLPSALVTVGKNPFGEDRPRPMLTPQQRRQIFGAIRKVWSGVANYGNPAIIDGLIENVELLNTAKNEMGYEKSEEKAKKRILSSFGVSDFNLGENMPGSYSQSYVVDDKFCRKVNVFLNMLGQTMTGLVNANSDEDKDFLVWYDKCFPSDPKLESENHHKARQRGDISHNEVRAWLGFPPDEERKEETFGKTLAPHVLKAIQSATEGKITVDQAQAYLEELGIPEKAAKRLAGEGVQQDQSPTLEEAADELQETVRALQLAPDGIAGLIAQDTKKLVSG